MLPDDLEEEILCRVPATDLKRLRSTCKRWNHLFKDTRFSRKHLDKAAKQFLPLLLTRNYRVCHFKVNPLRSVEVSGQPNFEIERVFHCNGFLLCMSLWKVMVWNPCTGQTKYINYGRQNITTVHLLLGYHQDDNDKKRYKILSREATVMNSEKEYSTIYDCHSDSWRIIDDIAPGWDMYSGGDVSLKGNIYWFVTNENDHQLSLLKFDFSTEKYEHVPLPYEMDPIYDLALLSVVREEKLSLLVQLKNSSVTEIWVTNKIISETKVISWSKVLTLDFLISNEGCFLFDEENKVVLCCERFYFDDTPVEYLIYTVDEDSNVTQTEIGADSQDICFPRILNYVPSLEVII